MNTMILIIAGGILLLFMVLLILFLYLLMKRLKEQKEEASFQQYFAETREEWFGCLIDATSIPDKLIPKTKQEKYFADKILVHYANNITDDATLRMIQQFILLHLDDFYQKQLHHKKWSNRINVLHKIIYFQMNFLSEDVKKMLESNVVYTKEEYILMYRIIAMFHRADFPHLILNPKISLGEYDYKKIMLHHTEEEFNQFLLQFPTFFPTLQYTMLELIGTNKWLHHIDFVEEKLQHEDCEIRIRALKSISEIGLLHDLQLYKPFLQSENWIERLMLSKLLIHVQDEEALSMLEKLISDEMFQVRSQAAATLKASEKGQVLLREIVNISPDKYAQEIALQMIGRE